MSFTSEDVEVVRSLSLQGLNSPQIVEKTGYKLWRVQETKKSLGLSSPVGWTKNRPRSTETREKISKSMLGLHRSEETRQRMKDSWFNGSRLETMKAVGQEVPKEEWDRRAVLRWESQLKNQTGRYTISKVELRLKPVLEEQGYEHTGSGLFFITGKDGRIRVPDFVDRNSRRVFEVWGTYWHRDRVLPPGERHETREELIQWYQEVGWVAEVVWDEDVEELYHV